jgi:acetate kinase
MPMRERITAGLHYLDVFLDNTANLACDNPATLTCISKLGRSKPIYVVPTDEASEIARRAASLPLPNDAA